MQPLNAIDAISPAFTRTMKCSSASRATTGERGSCARPPTWLMRGVSSFPFRWLAFFVLRAGGSGSGRGFEHPVGGIGCAVCVLPAAVVLRVQPLEFVEFELLVTRERMVAPAWRRYGQRTWAWLLMKMVVGTVVCSLLAPLRCRSDELCEGTARCCARSRTTAAPFLPHTAFVHG